MGTGSGGRPTAPAPPSSCPGFVPATCPAFSQASASGFVTGASGDLFRSSSVADYVDAIHVPVYLAQGEADSLFSLQESVATYDALRARHAAVAVVGAQPARRGAGEYPVDGGPSTYAGTHQGQSVLAWFDHYLRDEGPTPADDFTYFRPWVYDGASGSLLERARAAYGVAPSYPLPGPGTVLRLSGSDALVGAGQPAQPGSVSVVAPAARVGSYSETSVLGALGSYEHPVSQPPPSDPPGTAATYTGQPLAAPLDVVGVPQAVVHS